MKVIPVFRLSTLMLLIRSRAEGVFATKAEAERITASLELATKWQIKTHSNAVDQDDRQLTLRSTGAVGAAFSEFIVLSSGPVNAGVSHQPEPDMGIGVVIGSQLNHTEDPHGTTDISLAVAEQAASAAAETQAGN
jgi:hypothetical protein